ncbi:CDP-alcohol phosphatidyltransferase family protein [Flavobacterium sp.]|uniref:CDP-alcohol phosphatidyltransferase family protein n=1 Tax=Flavobacterium sp. TaxID=239 RepID=UPI0025D78282|nr:CDP-alcohol phosphatidyltransferase family protein [Flavobacterium sp.]
MNIKAQIPNLFTMLNLLSGCVALVFVASSNYEMAFYFVCLGILFDFFDGFFARKFNVTGALGVQLDSLADMVTSGVVPGYVMYKMLYEINFLEQINTFNKFNSNIVFYIPFLGFIITLGACYRLAKFNIDERQSDNFIGLPTPANALFIASLPLINLALFDNQWVLIGITFLSVYIMNAEIPLFSLKIKDFSFAKYKLQIFFLAIAMLLLIFLKIVAVPFIIILYVLLSIISNLFIKKASL